MASFIGRRARLRETARSNFFAQRSASSSSINHRNSPVRIRGDMSNVAGMVPRKLRRFMTWVLSKFNPASRAEQEAGKIKLDRRPLWRCAVKAPTKHVLGLHL